MRVLFVLPSLTGGGAEFVAREWAVWLVGAGHDVVIALTHPARDEPRIDGARHVRIEGRRHAAKLRDLRRLIDTTRPDVAVALMPYWNLLLLLARRGRREGGTRVVISGRNVDSSLGGVHGRAFRMQRRLAQALYRNADAYVAISHPVAAEAISRYHVPPARVWVVPNPSIAKLSSQPGGLATAPADGSGSKLSVAVPARLVAQKRPHLAIDVAVELEKRHGLDVTVDFFGSGPLSQDVAIYAERRGIRVRFHGWVENWFDRLEKPTVVLLPSVAEGFGNVLVEAAARGVPSVASSRALGVADAIIPGVTGALVADDSPAGFADAVAAYRGFTVVGIERWLDRFSTSSSGRALESVLRDVTERST